MSNWTSSPAILHTPLMWHTLYTTFEIGLTSRISALSSPAPNDKIYYWHDVYSRYNNVFSLITFSWRVGIHEEPDLPWIQFDINAFRRTVDATIKTTSLNSITRKNENTDMLLVLQQKHTYRGRSPLLPPVSCHCRFRESNQTRCHGCYILSDMPWPPFIQMFT